MSILKDMLSRVKQQVRFSLEKLDDTGADRNAEDCRRIGKKLMDSVVNLNMSILAEDSQEEITSQASDLLRLQFSAFMFVMKEYAKERKLGTEKWPTCYTNLVKDYNTMGNWLVAQRKKEQPAKKMAKKRERNFGDEEDDSSSGDEKTKARRARWSKMTLREILSEDEGDIDHETVGPSVTSSTMIDGHSEVPDFDMSSI